MIPAAAVDRAAPSPAAGAAARTCPARLWEVDVVRTLAIVMMIVYHTAYDVDMWVPDAGIDPQNGGWRALQVTCASTFLGLVGVSAWIRAEHLRERGAGWRSAWRLGASRGLRIAAAAAAVSLGTLLALGPDDMVRFGILHLIALAHLFILPAMVRLGPWNAAIGVAVVAGGLVLKGTDTNVEALLVIGLDPGPTGVDWFPLLPWAGVPLIGVAAGAWLYPRGERRRGLDRFADMPAWGTWLGVPGRRSLTVYLVHQPVLLALTASALIWSGTSVVGP